MGSIPNNFLNLSKSEILRHFIKDVGIPLNLAPTALSLSPSDFMAWWSGHKKSQLIQKHQILSIAQYLHIDENDILTKNYDKKWIRSVLFSGSIPLPEKYAQNQFSNLRTSAHIFKFLTLSRGQHFSDLILRKMNLSPKIYANLDNKISLNFFIDLLEVLHENGLGQHELDTLACVMFLGFAETPLGEAFSKAKNHYDCYKIACENIHLFDSNFIYTFELDRSAFRMTAFLPFDHHAQINWMQVKLQRLLRYRQLLVGWFPYLSMLAPVLPEVKTQSLPDGIRSFYKVDFAEYSLRPVGLVE